MAKLPLAVRVGIAPDPAASTPNVDSFVLGGARGTHAAVIAVRAAWTKVVVGARLAVVAFAVACVIAGICALVASRLATPVARGPSPTVITVGSAWTNAVSGTALTVIAFAVVRVLTRVRARGSSIVAVRWRCTRGCSHQHT